MLKPQDVVLLLKLLANPEHLKWKQASMAMHLCISVSEINASIKRLISSNLLQVIQPSLVEDDIQKQLLFTKRKIRLYQPILTCCEEFLVAGVKYMFPVKLGEMTAGIVTSYASPILKEFSNVGSDPIPVWPYAKGKHRGMSLKPLYPSVPKSVALFPDKNFYDLLCLIDVIRHGNCREYDKAVELLKKRINGKAYENHMEIV